MWLCPQWTCPEGSSSWVNRGCLLGVGSGTEQKVGKRRLEGDDVWDSQEMGAGVGQGRLPQVFYCSAMDETG